MTSSPCDYAIDAALALAAAGRIAEATADLRAVAIRFPDIAEPWRLIGVLALQGGDAPGARSALEQALRIEPGSPVVLCNLGALARSQGDLDAAQRWYRMALDRDPTSVTAHNNLGGLLFALGHPVDAERHYRAALATAPDHAPARSNLAACLLALDRGREAQVESARALRDAPPYAPAWLAHARVQQALAAPEDACRAYARARELGLRTPDVHYGMAQALDDLERWTEALAACEDALRLDGDYAAAASLAQYLRRRLCRHDGIQRGQHRLFELIDASAEGIAPFAFLSEDADPARQRRVAELSAASVLRRLRERLPDVPVLSDTIDAAGRRSLSPAPRSMKSADPNASIRVGFVSSGFGQHPTALLIVELIEHLRGGPIEAIGYATTPDDGGVLRRRLGAGFAVLHDLGGLSHDAMAARIRADAPTVLVDLRGWGGGSVAEVFAQRPAPIQVNWLAYPGTSGAPWIDYLLADRFVVPDTEREHYSESLIRLPHAFQPSDSTRVVGEPPTRAALGLPDRATVFACFNNSYKYSPESLARFWRILSSVPGSVLWLLDGKHADIRDHLRTLARAAGIDPDRLAFLPKQPHDLYLACFRHVDLFLDTTPYNAHTTASDALWAGCPVLTVPGRSFASRVAGSLNHTLGLDDMNARDDDAFVAAAITLGCDAAARDRLHARLAAARQVSPLFDMPRFARQFSRAITAMVERQRDGETPADIDLDP